MSTCPRGAVWLLPIVLVSGWLADARPAAADWTYRTGALGAWHQVSERDDDNTRLVRERGMLAGVTGALENRAGYWSFGVDGDALRGSLDYDGATQSGTPLDSDTDWENRRAGVYLGRRIHWRVPINLGASLEYQWRNRDIASTLEAAGLQEDYETVWLGVKGSAAPWKSMALDFQFGCALESTVDVKFRSELDRASLTVKDHCRASVAAGMDLGHFNGGTFYVRPFASWEEYPRTDAEQLTSNGVPVGRVFLPETEFLTFGITIGVRRSLRSRGSE